MRCPYCKNEINLKEEKIRSNPQNRYYWGVIVEILSQEFGLSKNETHELLKSEHLKDLLHFKVNDKIIEKEKLNFKVMLGAYIGAELNNFGCPWGAVYTDKELCLNKI